MENPTIASGPALPSKEGAAEEQESQLWQQNVLVGIDTDLTEFANFPGVVIRSIESLKEALSSSVDKKRIWYLTGKLDQLASFVSSIPKECIRVVEERAINYAVPKQNCVSVGQVPLNVNNVGIYCRDFFDSSQDYFKQISAEHKFQFLTESTKGSAALRQGIYLSHVEEWVADPSALSALSDVSRLHSEVDPSDASKSHSDARQFHLLRCSTNLGGPTDNFRSTDLAILGQVNHLAQAFFTNPSPVNHVLAQIYWNSKKEGKTRERKAKISRHADKTKDMPKNGLMAFCTFYESFHHRKFHDERLKEIKRSKEDPYDWRYRNTSVLTRLRFKLKDSPSLAKRTDLVHQFDVILYPNSLFLMSLEANRMYTHEIIPSDLPVDLIPTRLGYVARCSKTKAVHSDNTTYILEEGKHVPLEAPTPEGIKQLKDQYFLENVSDEHIPYGAIYFSLNEGDYKQPIL